ncbi:MAG: hypothetical protein ACRD4I_16265 [Candidatus Angelobacter sp.]
MAAKIRANAVDQRAALIPIDTFPIELGNLPKRDLFKGGDPSPKLLWHTEPVLPTSHAVPLALPFQDFSVHPPGHTS